MAYQNILVCLDSENEPTFHAYNEAISFARNESATLYLCSIINTKAYGAMSRYDKNLVPQVKQMATDYLSHLHQKATTAGVNAKLIVDTGLPVQKIVKSVVPRYNIDLIIHGATGGNKIEKALEGSISKGLIKKSQVDCLVVKPRDIKAGVKYA
ncbi:universal stress protein [Geomicrobium sediminis]|uniref:Nucleotide-binding universal stress UspA family protein n=1 Tax=Geomicrobium sediminis TaxID=1347788 RepID=A0ABS2PE98_9BACL|nr:universal stress protein [Geomicrobium sediminis]MBM7633659.1 nucleotide-binding universal stress UspA family protein [Geomicrobium sediminis]